MIRRFILIVLFTLTSLVIALPVYAQSPDVYVDLEWKGREEGTQGEPYNKIEEAKAIAQTRRGGAWISVKQSDGTWKRQEFVREVNSGPLGTPLADASLYALLAVLALALILVGWQFQRRSKQLRN